MLPHLRPQNPHLQPPQTPPSAHKRRSGAALLSRTDDEEADILHHKRRASAALSPYVEDAEDEEMLEHFGGDMPTPSPPLQPASPVKLLTPPRLGRMLDASPFTPFMGFEQRMDTRAPELGHVRQDSAATNSSTRSLAQLPNQWSGLPQGGGGAGAGAVANTDTVPSRMSARYMPPHVIGALPDSVRLALVQNALRTTTYEDYMRLRRDILSEEEAVRLSGNIRSGLAEGVRGVDAVGRGVRGDGSLVLGGGEEEEEERRSLP